MQTELYYVKRDTSCKQSCIMKREIPLANRAVLCKERYLLQTELYYVKRDTSCKQSCIM